jgi:hypothetical protein
MSKITKILDELDSDELEMFEKDLKEGYVQKYIDQKKEFFKIKDKICPVCGNNVEEDCFVLVFGEPSIRKKAHFCGIDCLDYFVHNFIIDKNKKIKKEIKNPKV